MNRYNVSLAAFVGSIATLIWIVFVLIRTPFFTRFFVISVFFGPGLAISYGLENPAFEPAAHLFTLLVIEVLSVIIMYGILRRLPTERRFRNRLLDKITNYLHESRKNVVSVLEKASNRFSGHFGHMGFYAALGFISFTYGVYTAAVVAYFLRVRLKEAVISIAAGGAFAIVFWWFMALGYIPFLTPFSVIAVMTSISAILIIYGFFRENRVVKLAARGLLAGKSSLDKLEQEGRKHVMRAKKELAKAEKELRKAKAELHKTETELEHAGKR